MQTHGRYVALNVTVKVIFPIMMMPSNLVENYQRFAVKPVSINQII
jgi:hypothetical protein